jgi:hypothetical protein
MASKDATADLVTALRKTVAIKSILIQFFIVLAAANSASLGFIVLHLSGRSKDPAVGNTVSVCNVLPDLKLSVPKPGRHRTFNPKNVGELLRYAAQAADALAKAHQAGASFIAIRKPSNVMVSATTEIVKIMPVDLGLGVSPDGRTLLYGQVDRAGSNIMLVENFH